VSVVSVCTGQVEVFNTKFDDASVANKALQHVHSGKVRYRAVLAYQK